MKRHIPILLLALLLPPLPAAAAAGGQGLKPFSSDGCSLFPDGTPAEKDKWCDCCFEHDKAYWLGGTAEERKKADDALRDCVQARTGDRTLAESMRLGVQAGGAPFSVMWYRWGYGWEIGRGYRALTEGEKLRGAALLAEYSKANPVGYCGAVGASTAPAAVAARPAGWARPVKASHLENFYQLDGKVYRSAQPGSKGFKELEALGIKNVLNLRNYHTDRPGKGSKLVLRRVEMDAGKITTEQVVEALRFIKRSDGPVLIHCWHGSDRTGTVAAMYRLVFQDWTKEAALDELVNGGYGFHSIYKNIPELIRKSDVKAVRTQVFGESGAGAGAR